MFFRNFPFQHFGIIVLIPLLSLIHVSPVSCMFRASFTHLLLTILVLFEILFLPPFAFAESPQKLPNILLLVTDDQRFDDFTDYMPNVKQRLVEEGTWFSKAYVTTPVCCPSRSSILTGLLASNHGVISNEIPLVKRTIAEELYRNGGYYLGHIGKYLNSWNGDPRPEYDYWLSWPGGKSGEKLQPRLKNGELEVLENLNIDPLRDVTEFNLSLDNYDSLSRPEIVRRYFNRILNKDGVWFQSSGYITDVMRDAALEFLQEAKKEKKPFYLNVSFNAPHYPAIPDEQDRSRFLESRKKKNREGTRTKSPAKVKKGRIGTRRLLNAFHLRQRQCLASVDRAIGDILETLEELDELDNTLVIFLSDNGLLFGEHHIEGKGFFYEEAVRVPFVVRYPLKFPVEANDSLVANIDIAPTIHELAGIQRPMEFDGASLLGIPDGRNWRQELLLEGFKRQFRALHTGRFVLVSPTQSRSPFALERNLRLYDLLEDPRQLRNLAKDPNYFTVLKELREKLVGRVGEQR